MFVSHPPTPMDSRIARRPRRRLVASTRHNNGRWLISLTVAALISLSAKALAAPQLQTSRLSNAYANSSGDMQTIHREHPNIQDYGIESSDDDDDDDDMQLRDRRMTATAVVPPPPPPPLNPKFRIDALNRFQKLNTKKKSIKKQQRSQTLALRFSSVLMVLTGVAIPICKERFGCFPNMMTGNTVRAAMHLADGGSAREAIVPAAMVAAYALGCHLVKRVESMTGKKAALVPVAAVAWFAFAAADVAKSLAPGDAAVLPALALGYGLVNTASLNAVGTVTNAVTGHWTKIGAGVGDLAATSRICVAWVLAAIIATTKAMTFLRNHHANSWIMKNGSSVFGTFLGTAYLLVFAWYHAVASRQQPKET